MGLFSNQLSNVVEWEENREDVLFWKWKNKEIKKGSRLIIRQGQDAIFMADGKVEGVFEDEGSYDIESEIIPFLSTLKGFRFGFNSGLRAEVLFINTKQFTVKWGTKGPIMIPAQGLPGGMPIRAFGTFGCQIQDYKALIEQVAGIKNQYTIEELRERVLSVLDQFLMKWIVKEGKDMFHLQADAERISDGIAMDLNQDVNQIGIQIVNFAISNFSYPEEIQKMAEKAASQAMIGDMNKYQQVAFTNAMEKGATHGSGSNMAAQMANMQMGMMMGQQAVANMNQQMQQNQQMPQQPTMQPQQPNQNTGTGEIPNFCPNCGNKTNGMRFCGNCGQQLG